MPTAGVVTTIENRLGNIHKLTFTWTSGDIAAGNATVTTSYPYTGVVLRAVTVPGGAPNVPDDNYDITLKDEAGVDVANSLLLNRSSTATQWVASGMGAVVGSKLTFLVDNANSLKTGVCYVYIGITPEQTDQVADLENAVYGASGIATFPAAAAAADGVSLAEVVRYIQASQIGTLTNTLGTATLGGILGDVAATSVATRLTSIANSVGNFASKGITYIPATTSYAAFTVSGTVAVKVVGSVTGALTNHADTTSVGTATSVGGLIAATAGSAMQTIGQIWVDNAPSKFETFPAGWTIISESIAVASTANIAGGAVMLNCWWFPVVAASTLVAA